MADISTEIAAIEAAANGEDLRQPLIDALDALNEGSLPAVTASDAGKILKVDSNGEWVAGEKSGYMPVPTASLNITENGTVNVLNYSEAIVAVPQSGITLQDEGKVVKNGTLVAQTARTSDITVNGTYDTTDNNSVTVNVSCAGGVLLDDSYLPASDNSKIKCSIDSTVIALLNTAGIAEATLPLSVNDNSIQISGKSLHVQLSSSNANSTSYFVSKRNSGTNEIFIHSRPSGTGYPFFNNRTDAQYAVYNGGNTTITDITSTDWHLYAMAINANTKKVRFFCDGSFLGEKNFTNISGSIVFNGNNSSSGNNSGNGDISVKYMGVVEDFESDVIVITNMQEIMSKLNLSV